MRVKRLTWIDRGGSKLNKLDRFLISRELLDVWRGLYGTVLDRCFSDHCPILLNISEKYFGPIPFRFYDWWLQHDSLTELVRTNWAIKGISGSKVHIFKEKLKRVKNQIKVWKATLTDCGSARLKVLQGEMNDWDTKAKSTELSVTEKEQFYASRLRHFSASKEHSLALT